MLTSYQKRLLTVISSAIFLIAPIEILHALGWFVFHVYELVEFILDETIHHLFHTSLHTTQVIVFYLMMSMGLYGSYRIVRAVRTVYKKQQGGWFQQKEKAADFFTPLLLSKKTKMIFGVTFSVAFLAITVF